MGYTHYWNCANSTKKQWKSAVTDIKKVIAVIPKKYNVHLTGCYKYENAQFTDDEIYFNGGRGLPRVRKTVGTTVEYHDTPSAQSNLSHETFALYRKSEDDFNFCKTARKPYDLAVCICLLVLSLHNPKFTYSSDGNTDEEYWGIAKNLVNKTLGTDIVVNFN